MRSTIRGATDLKHVVAIPTRPGATLEPAQAAATSWPATGAQRVIGTSHRIAWLIIGLLCGTVFAVDTLTNLEIAAAVLYVVPILLAVQWLPIRSALRVTTGGIVLAFLSAYLTTSGDAEAGLLNLGISIAALIATTWLAVQRGAATSAVHEARSELMRMTRLSSLAEVLNSMACQVDGPLEAARTELAISAEAARQGLRDSAAMARDVDCVAAHVQQAAEVIARVRTIMPDTPRRPESINVGAAVRGAVGLARQDVEERGATLLFSVSNTMSVIFDPARFQQVIQALLVNALEALDATDPETRTIEIAGGSLSDGGVFIEVADNGCGLTDDGLARCFDALWTTKPNAAGLGLTISRTIVEDHGGSLTIGRTPGGGTTVRLAMSKERTQLAV